MSNLTVTVSRSRFTKSQFAFVGYRLVTFETSTPLNIGFRATKLAKPAVDALVPGFPRAKGEYPHGTWSIPSCPRAESGKEFRGCCRRADQRLGRLRAHPPPRRA